MSVFKTKYSISILVLLAVVCYAWLGYFFERQDFITLFCLYSMVFVGFVCLLNENLVEQKNLLAIGLIFRAIFLFTTPFLSQDFYRFIWDGRLIANGINPYQFLPDQLINTIVGVDQANLLYEKMGSLSASHFSNYPPVNQFIFAISGLFSARSIIGATIIFRTIIIAADLGIYFYGQKLLKSLNHNPNRIFYYFLNPLIIIELTGNLHFEGVMLFFFVYSMYLLQLNRWKSAAVVLSLSICTKLLPLLLLPLFYQKLGFKKSAQFIAAIFGISVVLFVPFITKDLINNYTETIGLWFTNFEFNASIYYIIREIGFWVKGYNIIQTVGKFVPVLVVLTILFIAFFKKIKTTEQLFVSFLLVLSIYFFTTTTIHPWYVINIVIVGLFTNFQFPLVWSFTVILSYFTYSNAQFKENYYLLFVEYVLVYGVLIYEIRNNLVFKSLKSKQL